MKLAQVWFTIATLVTISISLPLPACRWEHDQLRSRRISSEADGLPVARGRPDVSVQLILRKEHPAGQNIQVESRTKRVRKQRRSSVPPPPPPDNRTPREMREESPNPTIKEMGQVLSEGEVEFYIEQWRAGKEYRSSLRVMEEGHILSAEERKQFDADRESYNEARRLEEYVKGVLVRENRARQALVDSWEKARQAQNKRSGERTETRARAKELKRLIEDEMARPEDLVEYEKVFADVERLNSSKRNSRKKKKLTDKQKLEELESAINKETASDAQLAEYKALTDKMKTDRARKAKVDKKSKDKHRNTLKNRLEELQGRIDKKIALSGSERIEYEGLLTQRQKRLDDQARYSETYRGKKRTAFEKLKGRVDNEVASPLEQAILEALQAENDRNRQAAKDGMTKKRKADKDRIADLKRRIDDPNEVVTDAERAEYEERVAKQDLNRERDRISQQKRREAKKKERAAEGTPPPIETDLDRADQTSVGKPLQLSTNPLRQKMESFLSRVGKLWQATSQAPHPSGNIAPFPGLLRPMSVPFGGPL
ncbi:MAG: hypothetical protein M1816_000626 [Peltula sp. TS41687]|nr:MAG: hypothetical protein M1816_000626 [Peltula sp. TS41687]